MAKREREKAEKSGRTHVVGHDGTAHRTKYRLATSAGLVRGVHHPEKTPSQASFATVNRVMLADLETALVSLSIGDYRAPPAIRAVAIAPMPPHRICPRQ